MLKKKYFLFALFILAVFGLLTYQSIKGESRFISFTLYPLRLVGQGTSAALRQIRNLADSYIFIVGKEEENRHLLEKISTLEKRLIESGEIALENERLTKLLGLKSERPDYVVTAKVYARDPTNWFQILWINKGMNSGIATRMVALTPVGPAGMVHRVFQEGASIMLVTDVNSAVAVRLQRSRIEGILEGSGGRVCYLKYISKDADVSIGENVVTSGLDGIYPAGLLIGAVSAIQKEEEEMFQMIEVQPAQDLNAVEEVMIIKR